MFNSKLSFSFLVCLAALCCGFLRGARATCNACSATHACVGRNEFQICNDGIIDTSASYRCQLATEVCTIYGKICMEESESVKPACGDISQCDACAGVDTGRFACTSRTTFAMCFNDQVYGTVGTCPDGKLCSVAGAATGKPCADYCAVDRASDICDRQAGVDNGNNTTVEPPTTTTIPGGPNDSTSGSTNETSTTTIFQPTPPTGTPNSSSSTSDSTSTSSTTPSTPTQLCPSNLGAGRYAYPGDTNCTSYVNCYWKSGALIGINKDCPAKNPYFNANTTLCGIQQPIGAGCV